MISILIMNGPNLNLLGTRQPEVYGTTTLKDIEAICGQQAASVGAKVTFFQSNHEGDLIDQIHAARGTYDGIILNAGALSHTSIAIMDAIISVEIPTIDMHLSNIHRREEFRHVSYVAKAAIGSIAGFGPGSYLLAIDAMMMHLGNAQGSDKDPEANPKSEPLETTRDQMLSESPEAPEEAPAPPEPEAAEQEQEPEVEDEPSPKGKRSSALAEQIAAATASAIASQKREIEAAVKGLAEASKPEAKQEPSAEPTAEPTEEPKEEPKAEAKAEPKDEAKEEAKSEPKPEPEPEKSKKSGFNEMFDTPSKEVLDSLGIAAPELNPPGKKEEAPKPARSPLRSFRKLS